MIKALFQTMSTAACQILRTTLVVIFALDRMTSVWLTDLASSNTRLRFYDIEDGSEAAERVARTTITDQMGEGQLEYLRVPCNSRITSLWEPIFGRAH
jgi:hypothetical protein